MVIQRGAASLVPQPSVSGRGLSSSWTGGKEGKESSQPLGGLLLIHTGKLNERFSSPPFSLSPLMPQAGCENGIDLFSSL